MIGALLSHHFRASARTVWAGLAAIPAVMIPAFALLAINVPVLGGIGSVLGVIAAVAAVPAALVMLAIDYWRTMYGREGYFTMIIPVRGRALYWTKLLHALIVSLAATALTLVGLFLWVVANGIAARAPLGEQLAGFRELILSSVGSPMLWFLVGALAAQLLFVLVAGATVLSVGAEERFSSLGGGAPIILGVALYFFMQVLSVLAMMFVPLGLQVTGADAGSIVWNGMLSEIVEAVRLGPEAPEQTMIGIGFLPLLVVVGALLAWKGVHSIERRTSLR
ncbi:hypothetical protein ICL81_10555 [Leucobacter sp. cx-328]|uniref:hypothetical protein n=1 Tax=unclassified Leucobacter TaxID=2621730 RepID=UPI00165E2B64|nr:MULTISPECIES: hypothetical protein [unclassified Leucobacter]MBC9944943.1 hypothetical protein [Leucobacter sp. cx-328]